ncbi:MAG: helix-turn-helix transcriptional regulator [Clostridiales bacterium]|nr:helix-turn-helix transcriptional regulator [Clostridiales bacterium]
MRTFSYKRLFKKLIDLDMTNNELMERAKVSKSTFYKMKNGKNVTTDVLLRICNALDCDIDEIIECIKQ